MRVRPVDTFETAESQHIGNHYLNTLIPQNSNKLHFDKDSSFRKDPVPTEKIEKKEESMSTQQNIKDESIEVTNWSQDFMPKLTVMTTNSPDVIDEVKELNKDDAVRNNSEEEIERVATSTVNPETEEKEIVTTITPEVATEDDSNMFDEVRKSLKDLFGMIDDDNEGKTLNIDNNTTIVPPTEDLVTEITTLVPEQSKVLSENTSEPVYVTTDSSEPSDPMGSLVLATSTSRHISLETEICYRGRCIKTDKKLEKK